MNTLIYTSERPAPALVIARIKAAGRVADARRKNRDKP